MKVFFIATLLLAGCSWRHKDFTKDLEKDTAEVAPKVEVEDKKLLEKFEVDDVKPAPVVKTPEVVAPKKSSRPVIQKRPVTGPAKPVAVIKEDLEKVIIPAPPPNYPPELQVTSDKAKKLWDTYKPNHPVDKKVYLDIHYLGMTVGKIMFVNKGQKMINGKNVWHFHARFKSAPFYSNIYELDDTVDTYVTVDKFLSLRYSLIQRESKQDIDDLQLQDREKFTSFWFYKRKKSNGDIKNKQVEIPIPYYSIDPFSVVFFYQGLPLKNGDVFEIPLINKDKILMLKSEVEGREKIETHKGKINAIRVHATTQYTGETLKSGNLYFWFSDDAERTLLKAQAKIKIGSVTAEIVDG